MCFIIDPNHPFQQIADRDITVYKVLSLSGSPQIFPHLLPNYRYEKKYLYKLISETSSTLEPINNTIHAGFHSYASFRKATENYSAWFFSWAIFKFIIPKGSYYYYNELHEEYVSNQIRMASVFQKYFLTTMDVPLVP